MKAHELTVGQVIRTSSKKWRTVVLVTPRLRGDPDHHMRLWFGGDDFLWVHPNRDFEVRQSTEAA